MIRTQSPLMFVGVCIAIFLSLYVAVTRYTQETTTSTTQHVLGVIVGRTNTTAGLCTIDDKKLTIIKEWEIATSTITDFNSFIKEVLFDIEHDHGIKITRACIGAPGKSSENHDSMSPYRISFVISAQELKEHTPLQHVKVVNDFELIGFGLEYLDQSAIVPLYSVEKRFHAVSAIVGVGNGVGSALVVHNQSHNNYTVFPLGYCYADFIAHTERDFALVNYIKQAIGASHMSWGYALGSTGGILKIYDFIAHEMNGKIATNASTPQAIFDRRLTDPLAQQSVDLYMEWYIRLLRTVALTQLPYNGLYITNTIAEKNPELFTNPDFLKEYFNCGHEILCDVLKEIPLFLILEPKVSLYGAAAYAVQE